MSIYSIHYESELLTVLVHQILIPGNTDNASEGMEDLSCMCLVTHLSLIRNTYIKPLKPMVLLRAESFDLENLKVEPAFIPPYYPDSF